MRWWFAGQMARAFFARQDEDFPGRRGATRALLQQCSWIELAPPQQEASANIVTVHLRYLALSKDRCVYVCVRVRAVLCLTMLVLAGCWHWHILAKHLAQVLVALTTCAACQHGQGGMD